jgi:ketosteroid isomerase-like protein
MSQENVEFVRKPLRVRAQSSRTLDQRLALRFPWLGDANVRLLDRLRPRSRLRQAVVWRTARLAVEAYNRRDLDANLIGFPPELEYYPARDIVEAGLVEPCYRGPEGYRQYVATWTEVWGESDYLERVEVIDTGERIVLLATAPMRAQASGVPLTEAYAMVSTFKDGRAVRIEEYFDHAKALEAVGLSE